MICDNFVPKVPFKILPIFGSFMPIPNYGIIYMGHASVKLLGAKEKHAKSLRLIGCINLQFSKNSNKPKILLVNLELVPLTHACKIYHKIIS